MNKKYVFVQKIFIKNQLIPPSSQQPTKVHGWTYLCNYVWIMIN